MSRVHCFLNIMNVLLKFTLFLDSLFGFSIWGGGERGVM